MLGLRTKLGPGPETVRDQPRAPPTDDCHRAWPPCQPLVAGVHRAPAQGSASRNSRSWPQRTIPTRTETEADVSTAHPPLLSLSKPQTHLRTPSRCPVQANNDRRCRRRPVGHMICVGISTHKSNARDFHFSKLVLSSSGRPQVAARPLEDNLTRRTCKRLVARTAYTSSSSFASGQTTVGVFLFKALFKVS
jgi:hypothetical protein